MGQNITNFIRTSKKRNPACRTYKHGVKRESLTFVPCAERRTRVLLEGAACSWGERRGRETTASRRKRRRRMKASMDGRVED